MLVASLLATSGSVMANAERISPRSKGFSHCSCCSALPNCASTSMLPVSGAAQLSDGRGEPDAAAGDLGERGVLEVRQAGPVLAAGGRRSTGRGRGPPAAAPASTGAVLHAHAVGQAVHLLVEGRERRDDALVHEAEQRLAQLLRAGVESEVHVSSSLSGGEAGRDEGDGGLTDAGEAGADGLALGVAVVDALEDHGELEVGEPEVEATGATGRVRWRRHTAASSSAR